MSWRTIAAVVYIVVAVVAFVIPLVSPSENLAGVYAVIVTLPWSLVLPLVLDMISPGLMDMGVGIVCLAGAALLNAWIIYGRGGRKRAS